MLKLNSIQPSNETEYFVSKMETYLLSLISVLPKFHQVQCSIVQLCLFWVLFYRSLLLLCPSFFLFPIKNKIHLNTFIATLKFHPTQKKYFSNHQFKNSKSCPCLSWDLLHLTFMHVILFVP